MMDLQPLDPSDRDRLGRKAASARAALCICTALALAAPVAVLGFLLLTPTEFNATTGVLGFVICLVVASPFALKAFDLRRTVLRVDRWLAEGKKQRLTGPVTRVGPHFMVTVEETPVAAWQHSRSLSVGDEVTVELLPLDSGIGGIIGVLSVDGEANPYFESAWRSGPPTA